MHCIHRRSWVYTDGVSLGRDVLQSGIKISSVKICQLDRHCSLLPLLPLLHRLIYTMADDQTSRLDNAGTLQQSVSTSIIHEKVTIVSLGVRYIWKWLMYSYRATKLIIRHVHSVYGRRIILLEMLSDGSSWKSEYCHSHSGTRADSSPDVEYCGYSAPHPSEAKIHLRIQMYGQSLPYLMEYSW